MSKKQQVFIVHGGMTFKNDKDYLSYLRNRPISLEERISWSGEYLKKSLGNKYQVIKPRMPLGDKAFYRDWKIVFERYLRLLDDNVILIGSSLGGIFLAKYLSENKVSKKIKAIYLISAPYDGTDRKYIAGGFNLKPDLSLLAEVTENLYLLFSADDDVVPVKHAEKYRKQLPGATIKIYKSKNGHFKVSRFPEIVRMIKSS